MAYERSRTVKTVLPQMLRHDAENPDRLEITRLKHRTFRLE
jgi:hypothetical protein